MRDLIFTLLIFGTIPVILKRPYIGVLVWSWIGYMNPHRFGWGFAVDFPFAQLIAFATIAGVLFMKEPRRIPWTPVTVMLALFLSWTLVTTTFSLAPDESWRQFTKVMKIQLMTVITLMLINSRERIQLLVLVIAVSIGFFGFKGGLFTLATGGNYMVGGPPRSFMTGNTEIGLAMIMTLPLIRYLQLQVNKRWLQLSLGLVMACTAVAIIGTYSRGALLGFVAMGVFLWTKSRKKLLLAIGIVALLPAIFTFMPAHWFQKMNTIQNYEEDGSAMGRIEAWQFAWALAKDRPFVGGGFQTFTPEVFNRYSDAQSRSAHSIYFQVMGEHGFVGLALFLALGILAWQAASATVRVTKKHAEFRWAHDLSAMLQVSLVGYATAGAFLGLANFDLFYHLIAIIVLTRVVVERELGQMHIPADTGQRFRSKLDTQTHNEHPSSLRSDN